MKDKLTVALEEGIHGTKVGRERGGFGMYSVGVNREFGPEGRGWNMASTLETATFSQVNNNYLLNRSVRVNFSYKFGKLEQARTRKKTRGVKNNDIMENTQQNGQ